MIQILKQLYADYVARKERARVRKLGKKFLADLEAKGPNLDRVGQVFVQKATQKMEINTTLNQK